jgi:uncharacterized protein
VDIKISQNSIRIGIISDTHGLLRPEIYTLFKGVHYIIHAGDIGNDAIIHDLEQIAPVCSVLGNTDSAFKFPDLSSTAYFETQNSSLIVLHDRNHLDIDPLTAGFNGVIYGHTHIPRVENKNGVVYINPGSAGPRRLDLPICVALLDITGTDLKVNLCLIPS